MYIYKSFKLLHFLLVIKYIFIYNYIKFSRLSHKILVYLYDAFCRLHKHFLQLKLTKFQFVQYFLYYFFLKCKNNITKHLRKQQTFCNSKLTHFYITYNSSCKIYIFLVVRREVSRLLVHHKSNSNVSVVYMHHYIYIYI